MCETAAQTSECNAVTMTSVVLALSLLKMRLLQKSWQNIAGKMPVPRLSVGLL